ncbi:unnamed protein product [Cylindrotheca closterium]|uniref:Uncharacterized protein n=1 Tax=Cylindrotheca closterium TaxID=2856 RepID=A0AAD2CGW1_9STRA|nr:unnamed protein product [Cylindrotheca closterium]
METIFMNFSFRMTHKLYIRRLDWTIVQCDGAMDKLHDENASSISPLNATLNDALGRILVFCQSRILMNRQLPREFVGGFLFGDAIGLDWIDSTLIGAEKRMLSEPILELMAKESLPDHHDFMDKDIVTLQDAASELNKSYVKPFCIVMCQKWFIPIQPKPKLIDF